MINSKEIYSGGNPFEEIENSLKQLTEYEAKLIDYNNLTARVKAALL